MRDIHQVIDNPILTIHQTRHTNTNRGHLRRPDRSDHPLQQVDRLRRIFRRFRGFFTRLGHQAIILHTSGTHIGAAKVNSDIDRHNVICFYLRKCLIRKKSTGINRAGNILSVRQSLIFRIPNPELAIRTPPTIEISRMSASGMTSPARLVTR